MSDTLQQAPGDPRAGGSPPSGTRRLVARELQAALDAFPDFRLNDEVMAVIRTPGAMSGMTPPPLTPEQAAVRCEERFAPGPTGAPDVRVLVYKPPGEATSRRGGYLHLHGGGYVLGTPEINEGGNRTLALQHDCVVVSVDYRLAPETRHPGPLEDCYAALSWLHAQATALGVDAQRIAIGGESAGGGHAAALALHVRERGGPAICFQLLDSPMLDDRTGTSGDPHPHCGEFVWTAEKNRYGWRALLGIEPGGPGTPASAAPGRVADLSGLPPAFIAVGALDLFLEEDLDYARRLIRAGVPTELHVIPGGFHGFGFAGEAAPQVAALMELRRKALARAFAGL